MAKYIVPSKAASGRQTFDDNLVGVQITDGTSQLTNTNFDLDRIIPQKDSKNFKTNPFSDFLTLDDLKKETNAPTTTQNSPTSIQENIKFKNAKKDAGRSLYGSLSIRISVSISKIIEMFPASFLIDKDGYISSSNDTATNIIFNAIDNTSTFTVEGSKIYNPFEIILVKPNSNTLPDTTNQLRNFYSSYKNYVVSINGNDYPIVNYVEPTTTNVITFKINGNPFSATTYTNNILVKPNNGMVEEFFNNLDDLESQLLNRETNPIYTSTFIVPKDSFDETSTNLVSVQYNWPMSKDNWNIQITGSDFDIFVDKLSSLATEIDDYKSNLIVRFLTSPQLYEFDSDDQKAQSVFQLYGQNFDKVKKYIDNIAYMRNISYDGMDNLPDILLKNLSETLGLSTVNLFDEKSFEEKLYNRLTPKYLGESIGKNVLESEYEFYRRILVNLAHIYKSKGTRSSINFFLKFLGAPEPLIKIDEYIYKVTELPKIQDIESEIFDLIAGTKINVVATYDDSLSAYTKTIRNVYTTYDRKGYPVDENTGLPRTAFNSTTDVFYQKGSGWYDINLHHRSSDILDNERSILTGRTKTLLTKAKSYSYGEEYFDNFRTLPGLNTGYELKSEVTTKKGDIDNDKHSYIMNRKNIDIFLDSSNGVNYDIWRKSSDLELSFGNLPSTTGITFVQFLDSSLNKLIKNSNVVRYKSNYITLEEAYSSYINNTNFIPYTIVDVHEFIRKMSPYWTQVIEQIIPATTLWKGGNLIKNNIFSRSKYKYKFGCQPTTYKFEMDLYPDFETAIEEDLSLMLGEEEHFRGLIELSMVSYTPVIIIDSVIYTDTDYNVIVSGNSTTSSSAKLFDSFDLTGCTITVDSELYVPLICDYKNYVNPDTTQIKLLWKEKLINFIDNVVNQNGIIVTYEFYVEDTIDKVKFTVTKNGPRDCSKLNGFDFKFDSTYTSNGSNCTLCFEMTQDEGSLSNIVLNNNVGLQGGTWSTDVFVNDDELLKNDDNGYLTQYGEIAGCQYKTNNPNQYDLIFLDASNCQMSLYVSGNTLTTSSYDFTIFNRGSYNYGLKDDSYVLIVTGSTILNKTNLTGNTITKQVKDVQVNDVILSGIYNDNVTSPFTYTGYTVDDVRTLGSIKKYTITVTSTTHSGHTFQVLPTTKLKVYSNKLVASGGVTNTNYHFDLRYPKDLQKRNESPLKYGDYIIDIYGEFWEVQSVDFNYCESNLYSNLNFVEQIEDNVILFNGDSNLQFLLQHNYENHEPYFPYSGCDFIPYYVVFGGDNCVVGDYNLLNITLVNENSVELSLLPQNNFPLISQNLYIGPTGYTYTNFTGPHSNIFDMKILVDSQVSDVVINGVTYSNPTEIDNGDGTYTYVIGSLNFYSVNDVTIMVYSANGC